MFGVGRGVFTAYMYEYTCTARVSLRGKVVTVMAETTTVTNGKPIRSPHILSWRVGPPSIFGLMTRRTRTYDLRLQVNLLHARTYILPNSTVFGEMQR